jgi:hypothetical protein
MLLGLRPLREVEIAATRHETPTAAVACMAEPCRLLRGGSLARCWREEYPLVAVVAKPR